MTPLLTYRDSTCQILTLSIEDILTTAANGQCVRFQDHRSSTIAWKDKCVHKIRDQGYIGEEVFDWLYDEAQTLRVMPSDEGEELSAVSQVRQRIESSFSSLTI